MKMNTFRDMVSFSVQFVEIRRIIDYLSEWSVATVFVMLLASIEKASLPVNSSFTTRRLDHH